MTEPEGSDGSQKAPVTGPEIPEIKQDSLLEYMRVYTLDGYSFKEYVRAYFQPPGYLNIRQQLERLAGIISYAEFGGLPIEIMDIENHDGLDFVKINLKEDGIKAKGLTWNGHYFQGSTGGRITEHTLRESFLQREYRGDWIDGVEFYYERRPMAECDWDHIYLKGLILRSSK